MSPNCCYICRCHSMAERRCLDLHFRWLQRQRWRRRLSARRSLKKKKRWVSFTSLSIYSSRIIRSKGSRSIASSNDFSFLFLPFILLLLLINNQRSRRIVSSVCVRIDPPPTYHRPPPPGASHCCSSSDARPTQMTMMLWIEPRAKSKNNEKKEIGKKKKFNLKVQ